MLVFGSSASVPRNRYYARRLTERAKTKFIAKLFAEIAAGSILHVSASLDTQLGQGAGERGVDGSDLLVREFFAETGFTSLPRFFGFRLVNAVGRNGEVRQDGDAVGGDFDESFARRDEHITAVLAHDHFARHHLRNQRDMLWQNPHLARHAWQGDHLYIFGVHRARRRNDFQFQRVGHVQRDPSIRFDFIDAALHVEIAFRCGVVLAFEDLFETPHRFGHGDLFALPPAEYLRHAERLAQKALNLPGTEHREFVLRRKLVHAKNRNDILQVFESLQHLLYPTRDVVVLLADDFRRQGTGGRGEWIYRRIDPQFGNRPIQNDGRVQVREGRGRRRGGQIVARGVASLDGER